MECVLCQCQCQCHFIADVSKPLPVKELQPLLFNRPSSPFSPFRQMNREVLKCSDVFINLSFDEICANEVAFLVASVRLREEDENWQTAKQSHEVGQLNTYNLMF